MKAFSVEFDSGSVRRSAGYGLGYEFWGLSVGASAEAFIRFDLTKSLPTNTAQTERERIEREREQTQRTVRRTYGWDLLINVQQMTGTTTNKDTEKDQVLHALLQDVKARQKLHLDHARQ